MNKADFLKAICGKAVGFEIPEVGTVQVKGLTVSQVQEISEVAEKNPYQSAVLTIVLGMVDPQLDKADVETLFAGDAGILTAIAERIAELSGMKGGSEDESPLGGNG